MVQPVHTKLSLVYMIEYIGPILPSDALYTV